MDGPIRFLGKPDPIKRRSAFGARTCSAESTASSSSSCEKPQQSGELRQHRGNNGGDAEAPRPHPQPEARAEPEALVNNSSPRSGAPSPSTAGSTSSDTVPEDQLRFQQSVSL
ncbi:hypothetical protein NL676_012082 [Syzygium grande]|nr:hypothetical protein NL676_012082 [Syzygium grande]